MFELRTSPKPRQFEKIEAVPLPPIPEPQARAGTVSRFTLEISNGVLGLAKRVAGRLDAAGVRTARLTNQRPFNQPTTEVQYREGYAAAATALASKLQHAVQVKPSMTLRATLTCAVLGKDVSSEGAFVTLPAGAATKMAAR